METLEFLKTVLPTRGWYYVAVPTPGTKKGFKHHPCETIEELAAKCTNFDSQDATVYYATASFREESIERTKDGRKYRVHRVQENVQFVKSFWLDLDVGDATDGKHYGTQAEAAIYLGKFAYEVGLPKPLLVNSGYGIHAYWPLTEDTIPSRWKTTAENLKLLAAHMGMLTDPARTADYASVLRPPGTHNRKNKMINGVLTPTAVPVIALGTATPVSWGEFDRIVKHAMKEREVVPAKKTAAQINTQINAGATVAKEWPPARANTIANNCNQMKDFREKLGNVPEPYWYAAIQLLDKTVDGEAIIHEWSKGYKGYNKEETDTKILQVKPYGPTSCATFESRNPGGCEGCAFKQHVSTPIQLGVDLEEAPPPVVKVVTKDGEHDVEIPNPPAPFKRGVGDQEGLYVDIEGVPIRFYPYDLYPSALEYDEADQFETTRVHHRLPLEGWKEFMLRSSMVHSAREFNTAMADQHVKYNSDGKYKDTMRKYMAGYLEKLQEKTRVKNHYKSCGWKEKNTKFLLGNRMFNPDGTSFHAGISHKSSQIGGAFGVEGSFELWKDLTKYLALPGWEHHAFTMMIAFGAPLLEIVGFNGTLFNMVGTTGKGKSAAARWMMSVYGDYEKAMSSENTTYLARITKLGAYGNLPMYIDELTHIKPEDLSQLSYDIANGAGREKLRSDSSIDEVMRWKTFVLSSSNHNLHDKLTLDSTTPEAQTMRIFEYRFQLPTNFDFDEFAKDTLVPTLRKNYGHAGEKYISFLVQQDKKQIEAGIKKLEKHICQLTGSDGRERFWTFGAACTVYGGILAKHCGLIEFDPMRVMPFIVDTIKTMRAGMKANFSDEVELLSKFLNDHQSERIVVKDVMIGPLTSVSIEKNPAAHAKLTQRLNETTQQLYLSSHAVKHWLIRKGEDYATVVEKLKERKILVDSGNKIALGAGTQYSSQGRTTCWQLDLRQAEHAGVVLDSSETTQ